MFQGPVVEMGHSPLTRRDLANRSVRSSLLGVTGDFEFSQQFRNVGADVPRTSCVLEPSR